MDNRTEYDIILICDALRETFMGVNVMAECNKMVAWLEANPNRQKKNLRRFAVNWLANAYRQLLEVELRETVRHQLRRGEARNF